MLPRSIIPLAWRNLTENKRRLLASVAGTAFAVTLMFMENGFRHAMLDSMVNVIERLDGQIVIVSRTLYTLAVPYSFPYRRIVQARAFPEVIGTSPVYVVARSGYWRDVRDGSLNRICVVGIPLEDDVLNIDEVKKELVALGQPDTAMADALSRSASFGEFATGQVSELSGHTIKIVGTFKLGINSQSNGNLIMSDRNLFRVFPELAGKTEGDSAVTVGLLRVRPGTDLIRLRSDLQAAMPADVRVLTLEEFIAKERDFWDKVAPDRHCLPHRRGHGFHRRLRDLLPGVILGHQRSDRRVCHAQGHGLLEPQVVSGGRDAGRLPCALGLPGGTGRELAPLRLGARGDRSAAGPVAERSSRHPGALAHHVRPVRGLRGAQAPVG